MNSKRKYRLLAPNLPFPYDSDPRWEYRVTLGERYAELVCKITKYREITIKDVSLRFLKSLIGWINLTKSLQRSLFNYPPADKIKETVRPIYIEQIIDDYIFFPEFQDKELYEWVKAFPKFLIEQWLAGKFFLSYIGMIEGVWKVNASSMVDIISITVTRYEKETGIFQKHLLIERWTDF